MLMGNLFENVTNRQSEFDLKGSIINRIVPNGKLTKCLKDVNLQEFSKELQFLKFQKSDMRQICKTILNDITYLAQHRLMDYSLLLITENNPDYSDRATSMHSSNSSNDFKSTSVKEVRGTPHQDKSKSRMSVIPEDPDEPELDASAISPKNDLKLRSENTASMQVIISESGRHRNQTLPSKLLTQPRFSDTGTKSKLSNQFNSQKCKCFRLANHLPCVQEYLLWQF